MDAHRWSLFGRESMGRTIPHHAFLLAHHGPGQCPHVCWWSSNPTLKHVRAYNFVSWWLMIKWWFKMIWIMGASWVKTLIFFLLGNPEVNLPAPTPLWWSLEPFRVAAPRCQCTFGASSANREGTHAAKHAGGQLQGRRHRCRRSHNGDKKSENQPLALLIFADL